MGEVKFWFFIIWNIFRFFNELPCGRFWRNKRFERSAPQKSSFIWGTEFTYRACVRKSAESMSNPLGLALRLMPPTRVFVQFWAQKALGSQLWAQHNEDRRPKISDLSAIPLSTKNSRSKVFIVFQIFNPPRPKCWHMKKPLKDKLFIYQRSIWYKRIPVWSFLRIF